MTKLLATTTIKEPLNVTELFVGNPVVFRSTETVCQVRELVTNQLVKLVVSSRIAVPNRGEN